MSLPSVQSILFQHLIAQNEARERQPSLLPGLHANASSAGGCARAIGFKVLSIPASNPMTGDSLFNFHVGNAIHDIIQKAVITAHPDAEAEVSGVYEDFITVRADLKYPAEDGMIVVGEIKSISDFGFEKATGLSLKSNGRWKKKEIEPEGPKPEHLLQTLISAKALQAAYVAIIYIRKTAAKDEPVAYEWRFVASAFEDRLYAEIERLRSIVDLAKQGRLADREYNGEILQNPDKVRFPCGYCSYLNICLGLGSGVVDAPQA